MEYDQDKDGALSFEEFSTMIKTEHEGHVHEEEF